MVGKYQLLNIATLSQNQLFKFRFHSILCNQFSSQADFYRPALDQGFIDAHKQNPDINRKLVLILG